MSKKLKLVFGCIYLLCLGVLLYFVFKYLDITQLGNYDYIKSNSGTLIEFKEDNLILFTLIFFIFTIIWILLLGFGTPIALTSGFIFGKWFGTIFSVLSFSVGCTLLYIVANYYFKNLIKENLEKRIHEYKVLFNKNEFFYYMIFRFVGGGGTPFAIQNILPVVFNMRIKNYFYSTLLGLVPMVFIINSLGAGIENLIDTNNSLSILTIIKAPEIYLPIMGFFLIMILAYFVKKRFL